MKAMRHTALSIALAAPLVLAACSSGEGETVYVTQTSWVDDTGQSRDDAASPANAPTEQPAEQPAEPAGQPAVPAFALDPAYQGKVGGSCGTTPEGAAIRTGKHTSCDLAAVVYPLAMSATYSMTSNPATVSVPRAELNGVISPVTGGSYDLACSVGSDGRTLSCMGAGNDPLVAFDSPGRRWVDLLNIV